MYSGSHDRHQDVLDDVAWVEDEVGEKRIAQAQPTEYRDAEGAERVNEDQARSEASEKHEEHAG